MKHDAGPPTATMNQLADQRDDDSALSRRLASGDREALESLLRNNRERLKKMVMLRLSPDLAARVDGSDIIQEAFLQAALHCEGYDHDPERPFYLWIRKITENKLLEAHRRHVGAAKRGVYRETGFPDSRASVDSQSLAGLFVDSSGSGPLSRVMRAELRGMIQEALEEMDPVDREVLVLRHFEQLSLSEIGAVLNVSKSGAAKRYRVAVERLRGVVERIPGLL